MNILCSAISHIGLIRENNEDNLYVNGKYREDIKHAIAKFSDEDKSKAMFAVFDGMGGESFGEIASLKAAEELCEYTVRKLIDAPEQYIESANINLCNEIEKNEGRQMGTTVALVVIDENNATVSNVGDSRIYRLTSVGLERLSKDHTRAQQMVDAGILSEEEAKCSPLKHMLTQHLGIVPEEFVIEPYTTKKLEIKKGDLFLLCSDGLTDMLSDEQLEMILRQDEPPECIANELIERALDAGGKDNITLIIIKVE